MDFACSLSLKSGAGTAVTRTVVSVDRLPSSLDRQQDMVILTADGSYPKGLYVSMPSGWKLALSLSDLQLAAAGGNDLQVLINQVGTTTFTGAQVYNGGALTAGVDVTAGAGVWCVVSPKYVDFVTGETPTGTVNGTNDDFVLANTPVAGLVVILDGAIQTLTTDYTMGGAGGKTISFVTPPPVSSVIRANYIK